MALAVPKSDSECRTPQPLPAVRLAHMGVLWLPTLSLTSIARVHLLRTVPPGLHANTAVHFMQQQGKHYHGYYSAIPLIQTLKQCAVL